MSKKSRKRESNKELNDSIRSLIEFVPKTDEPCDDKSCRSCYKQIKIEGSSDSLFSEDVGFSFYETM